MIRSRARFRRQHPLQDRAAGEDRVAEVPEAAEAEVEAAAGNQRQRRGKAELQR